MADIRSREDIVIYDALDSSNSVSVDSDGDLHSKSKLWDGTNEVTLITDSDTNYRLATEAKGRAKVSTDNSTTTPLSGDGVFTGNWEEILDWSMVTVTLYTDVASATHGLRIEYSTDGTNVDDFDQYTIPASTASTGGKTFSVGKHTQYFRIKYTNGTSAQSEFRLQTILNPFNQKASSHKINATINTDDDAELVKSVITGENSFVEGVFRNAKVDSIGRLEIATSGTIVFEEEWVGNLIEKTQKWTETLGGSATHTVTNSILKQSVTTGATDNAQLDGKQFFLLNPSNPLQVNAVMKFTDTGTTNNRRMFGMTGSSSAHANGAFFWLEESTFYARTRFNSTNTDTDITSYFPTDNEYHRYKIRMFDGTRIEYYVDDELVAVHTLDDEPLMGTNNLRVHLHNQNFGVAGAAVDLYTSSFSVSDESKSSVQLLGAVSNAPTVKKEVQVDSTGRLLTNSVSSSAPTGATDVTITEFDDVTGTDDSLYTITNGKTLTIQQFSASAEQDTTGASVVELYEDPNGDLSVLNPIDVIFSSANSAQHPLDDDFEGDGTRRILMRRRRLSGGSAEIFGRWSGFEQ